MKTNSGFMLIAILLMSYWLQAQVISTELQTIIDQSSEEELIPIVIVLNEQPSLSTLENISPLKPNNERRVDRILYLKEFASIRQVEIKEYLQIEEVEGRATDIKFLWLTNIVAVKAKLNVITEISNRPEVLKILVDHQGYALADVTWNLFC